MNSLRHLLPWLLALVFIIVGVGRVSYEVNITALLPPDMKATRGLDLFLKKFAHRDELIVLLEAADDAAGADAVVRATDALSVRKDLVSQIVSSPPLEGDADAAAGFLAWALLNLPPDKLQAVERDLSPDKIGAYLRSVQENMATEMSGGEALMGYDPLGLTKDLIASLTSSGGSTSFASDDGRQRILFIKAVEGYSNYEASGQWVDEVRKVIQESLVGTGTTFGLTGHPAYESEMARVMQEDMRGSSIGSLFLTIGIFWLFYRAVRPLILVTSALVIVAFLTLAAGGFLLPQMNIMMAGFASILIGLVVDYGILVYQATLGDTPDNEVRKSVSVSIIAAAATTAAAFLALGVCSVPGISGLGLLVGMGIVIGALFMLFPCCDWLVRSRRKGPPLPEPGILKWISLPATGRIMAAGTGALMIGLLGTLAWKGAPAMDSSMECMKLQNHEPEVTMKKVNALFGGKRAVQMLVRAEDSTAMHKKLVEVDHALDAALKSKGVLTTTRPLLLWPHPSHQKENLAGAISRMMPELERYKAAVLDAGFEPVAWELSGRIFTQWGEWIRTNTIPERPSYPAARWMLDRLIQNAPGSETLCLMRMQLASTPQVLAASLRPLIDQPDVYLLNEDLLSDALSARIPQEIFRILAVLVVAVVGVLAFTFRHWRGVVLCCAVMLLNMAALLGAMAALSISWNYFNLAAILLALGTGIDYSIHVLLALQKTRDADFMRRTTGRALMGCCLTTAAGFASLVTARLEGLASMGQVCALALAINLLIAIFLLPAVALRFLPQRDGMLTPK